MSVRDHGQLGRMCEVPRTLSLRHRSGAEAGVARCRCALRRRVFHHSL